MVKVETLVKRLEKAYEEETKKECEELHNALAQVIVDQKASIPNILFVLKMLEFEFLQAKYKELMGFVKLTDKPPIKAKPSKKDEVEPKKKE